MASFPNKDTQFKKGDPGGPGLPKGYKHLSTHIKELMEDPNFEVPTSSGGTYKGRPVTAIVTVAIMQALAGDKGWADWIGKYAYGTKVDITTDGESLNVKPDEKLASEFATFMKNKK